MDPDAWQVLLRIRSQDLDALALKPGLIEVPYGLLSNFSDHPVYPGLLILWLKKDTREKAMMQAAESYVIMRSRAGMDWEDPAIVSVRDPGELCPPPSNSPLTLPASSPKGEMNL